MVDDLVHHVMKAGAVISVADIHPRPLAYRVEPTQDLDRLLVIGRVLPVRARLGSSITRRQTGARRALACGSAERVGCGDICHVGLIHSFRVQKLAASCPSRTDRNWASRRNGANTASSAPVRQAW